MNISYTDMRQIAQAMGEDCNPYIAVEGDTLVLQWWHSRCTINFRVSNYNGHRDYFSPLMASILEQTFIFYAELGETPSELLFKLRDFVYSNQLNCNKEVIENISCNMILPPVK